MNLATDLLSHSTRIDHRSLTTPHPLTTTYHPSTIILSSPTNLIFISFSKYHSTPIIPHTGFLKLSSTNDKLTKYLRKFYKNACDTDSLLIEYNKLCYTIQIEVIIAASDHFPISNVVRAMNVILRNEKCLFYEPECCYVKKAVDPLNEEEGGDEMVIVFNGRDVVFCERRGECRIEDVMEGVEMCRTN